MSTYTLTFALWLVLAPEHSEATVAKEPISKSSNVLIKKTAEAKTPKWKIEKERLELYRKQAEPFVGRYMRNAEGEYFEFYFSKNGLLKGVAQGIGEYNYRFALTDIEVLEGDQLRFKLKGKPCTARRLDDALVVTYPNGIKKYHQRIEAPLISKR
ncbi:MAG: hypothetical protein ACK41G_02490 [Candidatus Thermochlorobacter sp.]